MTTDAKVKTTATRFAVQATPRTGNTTRYVYAGATVGVICQVVNSASWTAITGGGWLPTANLTLAVGTGGFSPTIRHCGSASALPMYNATAYPWPTQDGWVGDGHGYYEGECVSFAAWAVRTDGRAHTKSIDRLGNANLWTGAYVDTVPKVGDVAQWYAGRNGAGSVGHVAYVAAVNADGTVLIHEYNWGNFHRFNARTIAANIPSRYLHF
jgi:surface antigen